MKIQSKFLAKRIIIPDMNKTKRYIWISVCAILGLITAVIYIILFFIGLGAVNCGAGCLPAGVLDEINSMKI